MEIAKQLKQARISKNMTQDAAAEAIGISRRALSYYESGEHTPNADILLRLCRLYDLPIESMIESDVEEKEEHTEKQDSENDLLTKKIDEYLQHEKEKKELVQKGVITALAIISIITVLILIVFCTIRFVLMGLYGYTFSEATAQMWTSLLEALIQFVNDPNVVMLPVFSIVIVSFIALAWIIFFIVIAIRKHKKSKES